MAAITSLVIAGLGLAAAGAGAYINYQAAKKGEEAQNAAIDAQQKSEALRQKQMELDATRKKRETVRQMLAARSAALATATAQGASSGSVLGGAYGGISGRTGVNELGINQNLEIGRGMFAANQDLFSAYRQSASASTMGALGSGISSLGGALMKNNETIARVGNFAAGKMFG